MIHVSSQDIAQGTQVKCSECPVALALSRQTGVHCSVSWGYVTCSSPGKVWRRDLPDIAARFVRAFDFGQPVSPFIFRFHL